MDYSLKIKLKILFKFEFETQNVNKLLYPIQYESSNTFTSFKFDVNPRTGFDDWVAIEPINNCDSEIMSYKSNFYFLLNKKKLILFKDFHLPSALIHPPLENLRGYRTGSEEEYFIRSYSFKS